MSGIIRWLAPHMFPQLNQQNPVAPPAPGATSTPAQPSSFQNALQNAWQRYGAQGTRQPPLAPPPHQGGGFNFGNDLSPSSVRVDFHPPPEPPAPSFGMSGNPNQPLQ